jgi:hypothetical protein
VTPAETVVRLLHDVDRRDWAGIRAGLADTVRADYTSLFGGSVEELAAGREWLVAGRYRIRVDEPGSERPRVSGITLDTTYQDGDPSLPQEASARVAAR